ncbi:MAG: Csu type fimbrial protein [Pseudomarimonas sp.]
MTIRLHAQLWLFGCLLLGTLPLRASCSVDTVNVAFGNYDPLSGLDLDGVGSVHVQCEPASSHTISLSAGNGSFANRMLQSGTASLAYNLYTQVSRSNVWGDGTGGTNTVAGSGSDQIHTVYGRIPASQITASAGNYADLIVVTVEF